MNKDILTQTTEPSELYVIIRREGADSFVVVSEMYRIECFVTTHQDAIDVCQALNESFDALEDGVPTEDALENCEDIEPLWYEWVRVASLSAGPSYIKEKLAASMKQ